MATDAKDKLYHSVYILEPFKPSDYNSETHLCPCLGYQVELKL